MATAASSTKDAAAFQISWHLQVDAEPGARGADRLDVVPMQDARHPRIHRHPHGESNETRIESEFVPPGVWLGDVNAVLGRGRLSEQRPTEQEQEE